MNADEQARRAHQEWLGYLQPSGLVVSPPALVAAQAFPQRNIFAQQDRLIDLVGESDPETIADFPLFTREFLGWEAADLAGGQGGPELPDSLTVALPETWLHPFGPVVKNLPLLVAIVLVSRLSRR